MKKLIVDSGSTKTVWALENQRLESPGINPVHLSREEIIKRLPDIKERIEAIHFYGAGCLPRLCRDMEQILASRYDCAECHVHSDMLGAARALLRHQEGIACILGTGSNSCLYNGSEIIANTPSLGFILGDEGSGASIGRGFLGNLFKGLLGKDMQEAFFHATGLTQADIIENVYRRPAANAFLASFAPFVAAHLADHAIADNVVDNFRAFIRRNTALYGRPDLPLNFIGSIAVAFRRQLEEACRMENAGLGKVEKSPLDGLIEYHSAV